MNKPLVSGIITTYKRNPEMVVRAAKSILNQTYNNIELIVVDDSPKAYELRDAVRDALVQLEDNRLTYIRHEKNMGACAARNTGIMASKGEFISFLDDDDEWCENKIEKLIEKMTAPDIGIVYCNYMVIDENKNAITECSRGNHTGNVYDELMCSNFIGSASFPLVRRECFDKVGMFDVELLSLQDYDMWSRIAREYKVEYVDMPLIKYYFHAGEQITTLPYKQIQGNERFTMLNKAYFKKHHKAYAIRQRRVIIPYALNKQYAKSFIRLCQSIRLDPFNFSENKRWTKNWLSYTFKHRND